MCTQKTGGSRERKEEHSAKTEQSADVLGRDMDEDSVGSTVKESRATGKKGKSRKRLWKGRGE